MAMGMMLRRCCDVGNGRTVFCAGDGGVKYLELWLRKSEKKSLLSIMLPWGSILKIESICNV